MRRGLAIQPQGEIGIAAIDRVVQTGLQTGIAKKALDPFDFGSRCIDAQGQHMPMLGLHLTGEFLRAGFQHQDLDARLVDVIAPAKAVINAQNGFGIAQELAGRQKFADQRPHDGRPPHAAANIHLEAKFTVRVAHQLVTDIVQLDGGAIRVGSGYGNFELARQIGEFRVKAGPLPQKLSPGTRVVHLIGAGTGILIGGNVADAVSRCLDRVHFHAGKVCQQVGSLLQPHPVVLDILPRGEMRIVAIIFARDMRQHPQLPRIQRAIGDRHPQHIGVQLQIETIFQPQRPEMLLVQRAGQPPLHLVAKLGNPGIQYALIDHIIAVHQR